MATATRPAGWPGEKEYAKSNVRRVKGFALGQTLHQNPTLSGLVLFLPMHAERCFNVVAADEGIPLNAEPDDEGLHGDGAIELSAASPCASL
jgi:hypothetical protein